MFSRSYAVGQPMLIIYPAHVHPWILFRWSKATNICTERSEIHADKNRNIIITSHNSILWFPCIFPLYWIPYGTYLQLRKPKRQHSCPGPAVHESSLATSLLSWSGAADDHSEDPCSSDRWTKWREVIETVYTSPALEQNSNQVYFSSHKTALIEKTLISLCKKNCYCNWQANISNRDL